MRLVGDSLGLDKIAIPIQRARSNVRKTLLSAILIVGASVGLFVLHAQQDAPQPAGQPGKAAPKGGVQGRLTWFDRQGKVVGTSGEPGLYRTLTISPDGKRIAVERADRSDAEPRHLAARDCQRKDHSIHFRPGLGSVPDLVARWKPHHLHVQPKRGLRFVPESFEWHGERHRNRGAILQIE